jgi:hypothetical protein
MQTYLQFIVKFVKNISMILDPKYNKESEECVIFGIASIAGRAILFHHYVTEWCGLL